MKQGDKVKGCILNNNNKIGVITEVKKVKRVTKYLVRWDDDDQIQECSVKGLKIILNDVVNDKDNTNISEPTEVDEEVSQILNPLSLSIGDDNHSQPSTFQRSISISLNKNTDHEVSQILNPLSLSIGDDNHSQSSTFQRSNSISSNKHKDGELSDLELFFNAAEVGDKKKMEELLLKDEILLSINSQDKKELYSALIWASKNGHCDVVNLLIEKGADINETGGWNGSTALMKACDRGLESIVDLFITRANLDIISNVGKTYKEGVRVEFNLKNRGKWYPGVIDRVRSDGTIDISYNDKGNEKETCVNKLLIRPITRKLLDIQNSSGMTALMLAAEFGHTSIVKKLLDNEANKDLTTNDGWTALLFAVEFGHYDTMCLLLDAGSCKFKKNKIEKSAILMAVEKGNLKMIKKIFDGESLEKINSVYMKHSIDNSKLESCLHVACVFGHVEVVRYLIELGVDIDATETEYDGKIEKIDVSPLMVACVEGNFEIVEYLVQNGAKILRETESKETALLKACSSSSDNDQIVKYLLKKQDKGLFYSFTISNSKTKSTCIQHACRKGKLRTIVALVDHAFSNAYKHSGEYALNLVSTLPYFFSQNNSGESAISLLSKYFKFHQKQFINFLEIACGMSNNSLVVPKLWLLDILPQILEEMESPSIVMNDHAFDIIYKGLQKMYLPGNLIIDEYDRSLKDANLLNAIVNVLHSLKHAGNIHSLEKRDLDAKYLKFEKMIKSLCSSACMNNHNNIASLLLGDMKINEDKSLSNIRRGLSFTKGALSTCIDNDMKTILGISQISYYVDSMFNCYLRHLDVEPIRDWEDIFQLRSNFCNYCRYGIISMFFLEIFCKTVNLVIIWYVLNHIYPNRDKFNTQSNEVPKSILEFILLLMFACSMIYEWGEAELTFKNKYRGIKFTEAEERSANFKIKLHHCTSDAWNFLDFLTLLLLFFWCICRFFLDSFGWYRLFLAISAIPLSLTLLRAFTTYKEVGGIVFTIFELQNDLYSFFAVFFIAISGFVIAFQALFSNTKEFQSFFVTYLSLVDSSLGESDKPNFGIINSTSDNYLMDRITSDDSLIYNILMILYMVLSVIVLLNLVVAKMNSTHEVMSRSAFDTYFSMKARTVKTYNLIFERNFWCILPPPFNIFPVFIGLLVRLYSFFVEKNNVKDIIRYVGISPCNIFVVVFVFLRWSCLYFKKRWDCLYFKKIIKKNIIEINVDEVSIEGTLSDLLLSFVFTPILPGVEIYMLYKHLESNKRIPQKIPLYVFGFFFWPVLYVIFVLLHLYNFIWKFCNGTSWVRYNLENRTEITFQKIDYKIDSYDNKTYRINSMVLEFLYISLCHIYIILLDYYLLFQWNSFFRRIIMSCMITGVLYFYQYLEPFKQSIISKEVFLYGRYAVSIPTVFSIFYYDKLSWFVVFIVFGVIFFSKTLSFLCKKYEWNFLKENNSNYSKNYTAAEISAAAKRFEKVIITKKDDKKDFDHKEGVFSIKIISGKFKFDDNMLGRHIHPCVVITYGDKTRCTKPEKELEKINNPYYDTILHFPLNYDTGNEIFIEIYDYFSLDEIASSKHTKEKKAKLIYSINYDVKKWLGDRRYNGEVEIDTNNSIQLTVLQVQYPMSVELYNDTISTSRDEFEDSPRAENVCFNNSFKHEYFTHSDRKRAFTCYNEKDKSDDRTDDDELN